MRHKAKKGKEEVKTCGDRKIMRSGRKKLDHENLPCLSNSAERVP